MMVDLTICVVNEGVEWFEDVKICLRRHVFAPGGVTDSPLQVPRKRSTVDSRWTTHRRLLKGNFLLACATYTCGFKLKFAELISWIAATSTRTLALLEPEDELCP
jgi:hypothetical protein